MFELQSEVDSDIIAIASAAKIPIATAIKEIEGFYEDDMFELLKDAQSCDIVFVFGTTASMDLSYSCLRRNIKTVLEGIKTNNPHLKYRLGLVSYRDPEDGAKHLIVAPLSSKTSDFYAKLESIEVGGGRDECEDVIGGLKAASELKWMHQNRLLFMCGDAPCHGTDYYDSANDNHPGGLGVPVGPILKTLMDQEVQIVFWRIGASTDKMIRKFNEEAFRQSNGQGSRNYIATNNLDKSSDTKMSDSMSFGIIESLTSSLANSATSAQSHSIKYTMAAARRNTANHSSTPWYTPKGGSGGGAGGGGGKTTMSASGKVTDSFGTPSGRKF